MVRAAMNQSLFREINERIESLNEAFGDVLPTAEWVCECAADSCLERMTIPLDDYQRIRAHSTWFPVLPGHEVPAVERVVERHDDYYVVEKFGRAGELAEENDPRKR